MNIGILGTGSVGRTLATALAGAGHRVQMGTRDPEATLARTEPDRFGTPALSSWVSEHGDVRLVDFAQAAAGADLVINATAGDVSLQALQAAGSDNLRGKVLIDVSNPLDFSAGFPPTLFVKETDSLGEQIQRTFPETMVVKSLNTMNAGLMLDPGRLSAPSAWMALTRPAIELSIGIIARSASSLSVAEKTSSNDAQAMASISG